MGAKVQCENYFPVLFVNKNGRADARTKLSLSEASSHCAEEIMLKESQFHGKLKQGMMGRCSEKDKETLKHTMLKHEEIFREQVRELHRLYRTQKQLMAELKRKDSSTSTLSSGMARDSLFQIHIGSELAKSEDKSNIWGAFSGTMINIDSRDHKQPISGVDCRQASRFGLLDQSFQIGLTSQEVKHSPRDIYSLQPGKSIRRIFDLERPADEYMDEEAIDQNEDETILRMSLKDNIKRLGSFNYQPSVDPETEVHLTLQTGFEEGIKENGRQNGPPVQLGFPDIRREEVKEFKQSRCSEEAIIFPVASTRSEVSTQETTGKQRSVKSSQSYSGSPCKLGQEYQKNEGCKSEWQIPDAEHEANWKEQCFSFQASGRTTQENAGQTRWLLKDPRASMKMPLGNSSCQGFIWQQPLALCQQREDEPDAVKQRLLGEHDARSKFLQEQWGTRYSGSKEGITTGIVAPQRNPVFALVPSKGFPIDISSASVMGSPAGLSQGLVSNSQGEFHPSGLWRKSEDTLHHCTPGVHSQNKPILPGETDLKMQNFDPQSNFRAQQFVASGSNGMNVKRQTSEFHTRNWYQNGSAVQTRQQEFPSVFHAGSPIFGQASVIESKSTKQQGAAYTTSSPLPSLSFFSANNVHECSRSPWPACVMGLTASQASGAQTIDDKMAEKEVELTLGLSTRVVEETRKNAPGYSHAINRMEDASKDNTKQVKIINNSMDQESENMEGGDVQSRECFTRTFIELPHIGQRESNIEKNLVPKEGTGFSDHPSPLSKDVPYRRPVDDIVVIKHLVDNLGEISVPPRKENLGLASDLTWKDLDILNERKGRTSDAPQAGEIETVKVGNLLDYSTPLQERADNNLELRTGENCMNRHINLHGLTEIAEHDMKMETCKENINVVLGPLKETGFDVDSKKQICVTENKFASHASFQPAIVAAEIHADTNLEKAISQVLDFSAKGNAMEAPKQREMEVGCVMNVCERAERGSGSHALFATVESMSTEYHSHGENKEVVEDGEAPVKSSFQIPILDISMGVDVPREGSVRAHNVLNYGQENQKGSEEAFCLSGPERVKILKRDEVENDIFAGKTDSMDISHETIKANLPVSDYHVDLEMYNQYMNVQTRSNPNFQPQVERTQMKEVEDPSCTSLDLEGAARDSSSDADLTADILLSIASVKTSKSLDANSCQFRIAAGMKKSLDWFADIILCNEDYVETTATTYGEEADNSLSSPESAGKSEEPELCRDPIAKEKACSPYAFSGLDFFESMTLMLKESSVEIDSKSFAKQQEEIAKLPPIDHVLKPSKRGKRRRDFQREILPSISSLSRQEITEDMQIIGGLIRSTGDAWQAGCTRRSAGKFSSRDDWFVPLTGRRSRYLGGFRAIGGSATTNVNTQQAKCYDQDVERINALSWTSAWGETIRRRRMQRHRIPVSSLALNPT